MRKTIVIVAGVTLALLAGCGSDKGGGGSVPGATTDREPCGLLTDDQVKKALGRAPKSHTPNTQAKPVVSCKWVTDEASVSLDVSIGPAAGYTPPKLGEGPTWERVDGVGDKAAFSDTGPVFFVVGGGYGVQILPGPELTDEEKTDKDAGREKRKQAGITAAKDVLAALGAGGKGDTPPAKTTEPTTKKGSTKTTETTKPEKTTDTSETSEETTTTEPTEETSETEPSE